MRLLNGQESQLPIVSITEHFISSTKPSNFTETLTGTGTVTYEGADKGTGKVILTATALNDNAMITLEQPLMLNKWKAVELTFTGVKTNIVNDFTKSTILVGLRLDGTNFLCFGEQAVGQMRCRARNNGTSTEQVVSPFDTRDTNRLKIVATPTTAEFYINESLVKTITTNIPIDKVLKPVIYVDQKESTNPKQIECGKVELKFIG